jgi:hypothetical protein
MKSFNSITLLVVYMLISSLSASFKSLIKHNYSNNIKASKLTKIVRTSREITDFIGCPENYPLVHLPKESHCKLNGEIDCYHKGKCKRHCGFLNQTHLFEIFLCSCQIVSTF